MNPALVRPVAVAACAVLIFAGVALHPIFKSLIPRDLYILGMANNTVLLAVAAGLVLNISSSTTITPGAYLLAVALVPAAGVSAVVTLRRLRRAHRHRRP